DRAEAPRAPPRLDLEHRQADLKEPIRELGGHEGTIKVPRNVLATVTVNVVPVGGLPAEEAVEESPEVAIESAAATEASTAASEEMIEEEPLEEEPPAEAGDAAEEPAEEELE